MPPLALALVLLAALLHAGWNLLLHGTEDRLAAATVAGLVAGVALLPAIILAPPWQVWPLILLSALAECAYALCLTTAYRLGALSLVYPLARGSAPLLVTLGGWLLLAQAPTPWAFAGAGALALGLACVATAGKRVGQRAAIAFALLTGVCIATYATIDAGAVRRGESRRLSGRGAGDSGHYTGRRAACRPGAAAARGVAGGADRGRLGGGVSAGAAGVSAGQCRTSGDPPRGLGLDRRAAGA